MGARRGETVAPQIRSWRKRAAIFDRENGNVSAEVTQAITLLRDACALLDALTDLSGERPLRSAGKGEPCCPDVDIRPPCPHIAGAVPPGSDDGITDELRARVVALTTPTLAERAAGLRRFIERKTPNNGERVVMLGIVDDLERAALAAQEAGR